ncbi:MAG: NYN domain-containing protein [Candidatus Taylorbacteria bacterium]
MMKTLLIIDGENLKGKLKTVFEDAGKDKPIWNKYDFKGLFDRVLKGFNIDETVFYFARIKEHEKSKIKSRQLIEEQRQLKTHLEKQGFKVIMSGRVRGQMEESQGGKSVLIFREKGVDVKIAVDMVSLSCDKKVKEIILCSSDSDLQPAIKEAKDRGVSCVCLGFEVNPNKGISYTTNKTILIRNSEVLEFEKIDQHSKIY